jgi:hypothetical protein
MTSHSHLRSGGTKSKLSAQGLESSSGCGLHPQWFSRRLLTTKVGSDYAVIQARSGEVIAALCGPRAFAIRSPSDVS